MCISYQVITAMEYQFIHFDENEMLMMFYHAFSTTHVHSNVCVSVITSTVKFTRTKCKQVQSEITI